MKLFKNLFLLFFCMLVASAVEGAIRLPKLVSNGMVLQRDAKLKIWGWADAGETVQLDFNGKIYKAKADAEGNWMLTLPKQKAGGPYKMIFSASNTVVVDDILIGDVWLCSGQSNMELTMSRVSPIYQEEIKNCANNNIRYFETPKVCAFDGPQSDFAGGKWTSISPSTIMPISALVYFYAKELNERYNVPVGMINSSLGGSPAESWVSEESIKKFPHYEAEYNRFKDNSLIEAIKKEEQTRSNKWYSTLALLDEGYKQNWKSSDLDDSQWEEMPVPGFFQETSIGKGHGVVWLRRTFDVPTELAGKPAKLLMGCMVDADSVFINEKFVGNTTYMYPPRRYTVPENVLVAGKNTIVVRLVNNENAGGFVMDKKYELSADGKTIDLSGKWKFKLGATMERLPGQTFFTWKPVGLYNAMIAPALNYSIKGVIWYQGESNENRAAEYADLFKTLINDWRSKFGQGNFPFIFAQLPNYRGTYPYPEIDTWPYLREAQQKALDLPNTAMAIAIDLGEWNDIHPLNKKDLSHRFVLAARKVAYGEKNLLSSGPLYRSMKIEDNKAVVSFSNVGKGLQLKNGEALSQFEIAGDDGKYVKAQAKLDGTKVIVWSDSVQNPRNVRYAWSNSPEKINLYNSANLPVAPFRTDN